MTRKPFEEMTADEQKVWLTTFERFDADKLPLLNQLADAWEHCAVKSFDLGLRIYVAFFACSGYTRRSPLYGDMSARTDRIEHYRKRLRRLYEKGKTVIGLDGELFGILPMAQMSTPRRGRTVTEAQEVSFPDVQSLPENIRAMRITAFAATEMAKTMTELNVSPHLIAAMEAKAKGIQKQIDELQSSKTKAVRKPKTSRKPRKQTKQE